VPDAVDKSSKKKNAPVATTAPPEVPAISLCILPAGIFAPPASGSLPDNETLPEDALQQVSEGDHYHVALPHLPADLSLSEGDDAPQVSANLLHNVNAWCATPHEALIASISKIPPVGKHNLPVRNLLPVVGSKQDAPPMWRSVLPPTVLPAGNYDTLVQNSPPDVNIPPALPPEALDLPHFEDDRTVTTPHVHPTSPLLVPPVGTHVPRHISLPRISEGGSSAAYPPLLPVQSRPFCKDDPVPVLPVGIVAPPAGALPHVVILGPVDALTRASHGNYNNVYPL
jgi:hypothetical protein